ncbi:MAG: hypothetical protein AAGH76_07035 [Pseudomonadota bacterium]
MKIKIEFDLTPSEFRESIGLPNVAGLQDKVVKAMSDRITNGVKDINVPNLVEGWLTQGLATSRQLQSIFSNAVSDIMDPPERRKDDEA